MGPKKQGRHDDSLCNGKTRLVYAVTGQRSIPPKLWKIGVYGAEGICHCEEGEARRGNLQRFSPDFRPVLRLFEGDCHASVTTGSQ